MAICNVCCLEMKTAATCVDLSGRGPKFAPSIGLGPRQRCNDCGVVAGGYHHPGCDLERCALCGSQAIGCDCVYRLNGISHLDMEKKHPEIYNNGATEAMEAVLDRKVAEAGGRIPWSGEYPGTSECRALGWYSRWNDKVQRHERCNADDPGAGPDLNRLAAETTWNPKARVYRK